MRHITKTSSVTFRLSSEEKEKTEKKAEAAGYNTISAYVRDNVINGTPKDKVVLSPESFEGLAIASTLSGMLNNTPHSLESQPLLMRLSRILMGVKS
jgi:hypothetical protein